MAEEYSYMDNTNADPLMYAKLLDIAKDNMNWFYMRLDYLDVNTEKGLKTLYAMRHHRAYQELRKTSVWCTYSNDKTLKAKRWNQGVFKLIVELFKSASESFEALKEKKIDDSQMTIISKMHADLITKMAEVKEICEGPEWNPDLHNSSE